MQISDRSPVDVHFDTVTELRLRTDTEVAQCGLRSRTLPRQTTTSTSASSSNSRRGTVHRHHARPASACSPVGRIDRCRHPGVGQRQSIVGATPTRPDSPGRPCIDRNSQSPLRSPVNTRPVRFAPWAAGARPSTTIRAAGSPNPGIGRPQYSSSRYAARFSTATCSRHSTNRGHARHPTISASSVANVPRARQAWSWTSTVGWSHSWPRRQPPPVRPQRQQRPAALLPRSRRRQRQRSRPRRRPRRRRRSRWRSRPPSCSSVTARRRPRARCCPAGPRDFISPTRAASRPTSRLGGSASSQIDAVYSSPLERAKETAAPIARACGLRTTDRTGLFECDFGDWTGAELQEPDEAARVADRADVRHRRSVSRTARASPRCRPGWSPPSTICGHAHPGGTIVCVSHADTIKAAVAHAMGTHIDLFQRIVISPASVTAITWHAGGPVVLAVNSTGRPLTELTAGLMSVVLRVRRRRCLHHRHGRPTRPSHVLHAGSVGRPTGDGQVREAADRCDRAVPAQGAQRPPASRGSSDARSARAAPSRSTPRSSSARSASATTVRDDRVLIQLEEVGEVDEDGELDRRRRPRPRPAVRQPRAGCGVLRPRRSSSSRPAGRTASGAGTRSIPTATPALA